MASHYARYSPMTFSASYAAFITALIFTAYPSLSTAHSGHKKAEASPPEGYSLVWSDEFDVDGLPDPTKWNYDTYRNKDGWWNEESQYYSDSRAENARIENGHLIIEAHKDGEQLTEFSDYGGQDYSSARLFTKGKASWTYGYLRFGLSPKSPENGLIAAKSILWNMSVTTQNGSTPPFIPGTITICLKTKRAKN